MAAHVPTTKELAQICLIFDRKIKGLEKDVKQLQNEVKKTKRKQDGFSKDEDDDFKKLMKQTQEDHQDTFSVSTVSSSFSAPAKAPQVPGNILRYSKSDLLSLRPPAYLQLNKQRKKPTNTMKNNLKQTTTTKNKSKLKTNSRGNT